MRMGMQRGRPRHAFLVILMGMDVVRSESAGKAYSGAKSCLAQMGQVASVVLLSEMSVRVAWVNWNLYELPPCTPVCLKRRSYTQMVQDLSREYDRDRVLVVGQGAKALQAALCAGVRFYPIVPQEETVSWAKLQEEALPKLLHGTFGEAYQQQLLDWHRKCMPKGLHITDLYGR